MISTKGLEISMPTEDGKRFGFYTDDDENVTFAITEGAFYIEASFKGQQAKALSHVLRTYLDDPKDLQQESQAES